MGRHSALRLPLLRTEPKCRRVASKQVAVISSHPLGVATAAVSLPTACQSDPPALPSIEGG